jgi:hypothetical protein
MAAEDHAVRAAAEFEDVLADVFRKAGWRILRPSSAKDPGIDLVLDANHKKYVVQLKVSSEGRRDRLIPLLSQAILQARAFAQHFPEPAVPIAIVAAKHIPASVAEHIKQFANRYAPDVGVGAIDAEGFRSFVGLGLERLDSKPPRSMARHDIPSRKRLTHLFSDLNRWMLKILLGQRLPESLISIPRKQICNASQLAEAAKVSVMSASRLVNQLANQGFLDESEEQLQVIRIEELLDLWISDNRQGAQEIPARWIIKRGPHQLESALQECSPPRSRLIPSQRRRGGEVIKSRPQCCLALFAAADALGVGFVRGVAAHIYLDRLTLDSLKRLGLLIDYASPAVDLYIRIPDYPESIFRASIEHEGVRVSDVLQVWLDVSANPARGREQADEIRRRALKPLFAKQR